MAMSLSADDEDYDSDTAEQVSTHSFSLYTHTPHKQFASLSGSLPRSTMALKQGMCFLHLLLLSSPFSPSFFLKQVLFYCNSIRMRGFHATRKGRKLIQRRRVALSYCLSPLSFQLSDVIGLSHVCLFQHAFLREKAGFLLLYLCVWMWFILVCHLCFVGRTQML